MPKTLAPIPVIPESHTDQDLSQGQALRALLLEGLARAGRIARTAETLTAIGFLPEDMGHVFRDDPGTASALASAMAMQDAQVVMAASVAGAILDAAP